MLVTIGCLAVLLLLALYRERAIQHERIRWENERRELLNRIKPETAIALPTPTETPEPVEYVVAGPFGDIDRLPVEGMNGGNG